MFFLGFRRRVNVLRTSIVDAIDDGLWQPCVMTTSTWYACRGSGQPLHRYSTRYARPVGVAQRRVCQHPIMCERADARFAHADGVREPVHLAHLLRRLSSRPTFCDRKQMAFLTLAN